MFDLGLSLGCTNTQQLRRYLIRPEVRVKTEALITSWMTNEALREQEEEEEDGKTYSFTNLLFRCRNTFPPPFSFLLLLLIYSIACSILPRFDKWKLPMWAMEH